MKDDFLELPLCEVVGGDKSSLMTDGDWIESKDQDPNGNVRLIQLADIGDGVFKNVSERFITTQKVDELNCTLLQPGDLLIARMPDPIGRCATFPDIGQPAITAVDVCIIRPGPEIDRQWLMQALNMPQIRYRMSALAGGGTRQRISTGELRGLKLSIPPLSQQRRISDVLQVWDNALRKLIELHSLKKARLSGLREGLLFGSLRLANKKQDWPSRRIGEVTHEVTDRNGDMALSRDLVMGVTNKRGIVPMREQTVAGDIARYKHLPPRAFAYNPMRINVGSIAMNEASETVLVSPDYVVFGCNLDGIEPDYLDHLRKTPWWAHYINSGGSGSVRQRTYYADLAALRLPLPDIDEQREIVTILNAAKAELSSTEQMIDAVKLQKRGLMQKLLTGEWRVNLEGVE